MLTLLSPAKTLDFSPSQVSLHSMPDALEDTQQLIDTLKTFSVEKVSSLMKVSEKIATLNVQRYADFQQPFALHKNAKQALLAFKGDVYRDWPLDTYTEEDFAYAQKHLRILSGLYGALRPMDLIQPYRLEMGTRLATDRGANLYAFWGNRVTEILNQALEESDQTLVVNLASQEYFKSVRPKTLKGTVITPVFKEKKGDQYKVIAIHAKKARGAMAHYILANRVETATGLQNFTLLGYRYDEAASSPNRPTFLRG